MADITMCKPIHCRLKDTCYRYKAEPTPRYQSYFFNEPYKNKECSYYLKLITQQHK